MRTLCGVLSRWSVGCLAALLLLSATRAYSVESVIHSFTGTGGDGQKGDSQLIQASDGLLYGTTQLVGAVKGTVFKVALDGSGYTNLHTFIGTDGQDPHAGVIQASNGKLYGTAQTGGSNGGGVAFVLNTDGTGYAVLHNFGAGGDGTQVEGGLIQASDGKLYGTTFFGGALGHGTVYRINLDGTGYQLLFSFNGTNGDHPQTSMYQGSDGKLYSSTRGGGSMGSGALFSMNLDGTGETVLHNFNGVDGSVITGAMIEGSDGALYSTSTFGGPDNAGTVFKVNKDGTGFTTLHTFLNSGNDGTIPLQGLTRGSDGKLYSVTAAGGTSGAGTFFRINGDGTGYQQLYSFQGAPSDGFNPTWPPVQASDRAFYGVTTGGGASNKGVLYRFAFAAQTITFGPISDRVYGAAALTLNATASSNLPVSYQVTGPATLNGSALSLNGVGIVSVQATQGGNTTYGAAPVVTQSFHITPALLTVKADDKSRLYLAPNPTFTATITGYVNHENATSANVTGAPVLSTAATVSSPGSGGPYPITCGVGTLAAPNYTFTTANGLLTIVGDPLQFTAGGPAGLGVNASGQFALSATLPDNAIVTWDFGDGSIGSGANPVHRYAAPGTYTVVVTVTNPLTKQSVQQTFMVTVAATPLRVRTGAFALKGDGKSDKIRLSGIVHLDDGATVRGSTVMIMLGTLTQAFVLDEHGRATTPTGVLRINARLAKGVSTQAQEASFDLTLSGNLKAQVLAQATLDGNGMPTALAFQFAFNGNYLTATLVTKFKSVRGVLVGTQKFE